MTRLIPFLLYLWLVGFYQVILGEVVSIYGVTINLPALIVLLVGLYKSELDSCWFGFLVGLVAYAGATDMLGWYAFVMALIGYFAYHARARINLDSIYSKLLLVLAGVFVHNVIVLIISKSDSVLVLLATKALTGALYTTIIAWVYFLVKDGKVTFQKFKAIF